MIFLCDFPLYIYNVVEIEYLTCQSKTEVLFMCVAVESINVFSVPQ